MLAALMFLFVFLKAGSHSHSLVHPIISKHCSLARTAELSSIQFFRPN